MRSRDPLEEALSRLPRAAASEHFMDRVLAGLEARSGRAPRRSAALGWMLAGSLLLIAAVLTLEVGERREARQVRRHRAEELRREHRELERELHQLRAMAAEGPPVLYLGGTEQVDLVMDLSQLLERPSAPRPVAWPGGGGGSRPAKKGDTP